MWRRVFRSRDSIAVGHLQSILESEGIKTYYRNEYVANTMIAIPEATPALCILEGTDVERGVILIRNYLESSSDISDEEQTCAECGEISPGTFATCWKCGESLNTKS